MPVEIDREVEHHDVKVDRGPHGLSVAMVSLTSGYATGGTAAYIRFVGEALKNRRNTVRGVARFFKLQPPVTQYDAVDPISVNEMEREIGDGVNAVPLTRISPGGGLSRLLLPRLATFLSRPALHSLGIALYNQVFQRAVAAAIPPDTDIIDYTGNGWEMIGFTALAEARRRGIPFTVLPFVHPDAWGDSPLDVRLYNQADYVFVCSAFEESHLISKGVRSAVLRRTGLAPASTVVGDGDRFRVNHGLGDRPLILFIGRKETYKGYHSICKAMEIVLRSVPDATLVAIGPDTEPPFPAVAPESLLDLGVLAVDSLEKADALAACNVFCMPSEAEAFGIVYVEAWANRKPVIGGTAPAVRELVREGETGFCVTQDPADVAKALTHLLRDPALCRQIGEAGYALQQSKYRWDIVAAGHEAVFREAQANRSGASK